jgi:serine/threonine protein kinase
MTDLAALSGPQGNNHAVDCLGSNGFPLLPNGREASPIRRYDGIPDFAELLAAEGFKDLQRLGGHGHTMVYRATCSRYPDPVALKVTHLSVPITCSSDWRTEWCLKTKGIRNESTALSLLRGIPHSCQQYEEGLTSTFMLDLASPEERHGFLHYRALALSAGTQTLEQYLCEKCLNESHFTLGERIHLATKLVVQISGVLKTLHAGGLSYHDLKPPNILIDRNEQFTVVDFNACRPHLEFTDHVSLAYCAPEILVRLGRFEDHRPEIAELVRRVSGPNGDEAARDLEKRILDLRQGNVSPAVDSFSLGLVTWETLAAGQKFFSWTSTYRPESPTMIMRRIGLFLAGKFPVRPPARGIPTDILDTIIQCLEPEPGKRPTMTQIQNAFLRKIGLTEAPG